MKDRFMIGALARLFHVSSDTLRHYDRIGLLTPESDKVNKYRYYNLSSFFQLSRILFLKSLDISLDDIKKYMSNKNTGNLKNLLRNKEIELDHKIIRLQNLKRKIRTKLELMESIENDLDKVIVRRIPERAGVFLDMIDAGNEYEMIQAFMKNEKYLRASSWLIEGQIYTSLSKCDMEHRILNRFRYFIEVVVADPQPNQQILIIPENNYACIAFRGPYRDMGKHYEILLQWIEENGFHIIGDSIERNIVDYGFSDSESEYISEIQIPIDKIQP